MKKHARRIILDTLGWLFVIVGVVGLLLPVLQGILFLIIGLYLLSLNSAWFNGRLERLLKRHPRFASIFEVLDRYAKSFLKKIQLHE